uniref:KH domain containing, RNA binding, signal transduction associated 1a n=1 Tax=Eptatretus burgeri TaxID=7764 RepID=A0A8C4NEM3_EPTBU
MAILGRGCMKDKAKEEEMRNSAEAKYDHLNDELHIQIEVYAPLEEAYCRMGQAVEHVKKYLIPDYNDDICQSQLMEMYLNGGNDVRGMGRGMASPSNQSMNLGRGRGVPPPLLKNPSAARPSPRGGHAPHGPGTMPARGGLQQPVAGRGAAPGWGMRGGSGAPPPIAPQLPPPPLPPIPPTSQADPSAMSTRGGFGRGAQLPHTFPASMPPKPPVEYSDYGYDSYESYAYERDPRDPYAYPECSYEGYEQEATAPQSTGTESYDYGHGSTAESYAPYGEQRDWVGASRPKAPPSLSARGVYRSHPYPGIYKTSAVVK